MITLTNATVVEFSPPSVREHVDILIEGPFITEVRENRDEQTETTIDCTGKIVWPGLICSHNHFYSGLARGITAGLGPMPDFISTLKNLWWKMDRALDKEILYSCSLICALEAVKAGTTAVIDHHASQSFICGSLETIRKGFTKAGLRGITCFEVSDRAGVDALRQGAEENISFAHQVNARPADSGPTEAGLVRGMIGGHAPFTLPDSALTLLADAVEKTDTGLHLHAGEDRYDVSHSHHHYGKDLLERLNDFGLLNEKAIIVHGLFLSPRDIALLNDHDSFLVHNARSNMNNGVGYNHLLPDVKNVGLGTDGIGSNMYEEFKFAYFKHRDAGGPLGPDDFLTFLYNGNGILERNFGAPFGRVLPGYTADLVISGYDSPTPLTDQNIAGHLAYGMASRDVETVIINGNVVYENRSFPFNTAPIYAEAQEAARRLWKNMDSME